MNIDVKVPRLYPMSKGNFDLTGETGTHPSNHYGDIFTITSMVYLAEKYYETTGNKLVVNDMSLKWGGVFDICAKWNPAETCDRAPDGGHFTHRMGTDVDVRSRSMPQAELNNFKELVCTYKGYPLLHGSNVHWHLYFYPYSKRIKRHCEDIIKR